MDLIDSLVLAHTIHRIPSHQSPVSFLVRNQVNQQIGCKIHHNEKVRHHIEAKIGEDSRYQNLNFYNHNDVPVLLYMIQALPVT